MKYILTVMTMLFLHVTLSAQNKNSIIHSLVVGDSVPEAIWNMPLYLSNQSINNKTIVLNEYKNKLVILDFWATWCGGCIEAFPKMHQLQKQFKNQVKVLLINSKSSGDDELKVSEYFQKRELRTGQTVELPYILEDTMVSSLFPHKYVPHYVWLMDRKVVAITSGQEVNAFNILKFLKDTSSSIHTKFDISDFDSKKPLYFITNKDAVSNVVSSSLISKYIEGIGRGTGRNVDSLGRVTRLYFLNKPLMDLYRTAYSAQLNKPDNQIFFEMDEKVDFEDENVDYENQYCYELITPPIQLDSAFLYMQEDLYKTFKIKVVTEKRTMKVWVVKSNTKLNKIKAVNGEASKEIDKISLNKYIRNEPVSTLIDLLNSFSKLPIIDKSNCEFNIDLELPREIYDYDMVSISKWLEPYGLELCLLDYELDVAIIRKDGI